MGGGQRMATTYDLPSDSLVERDQITGLLVAAHLFLQVLHITSENESNKVTGLKLKVLTFFFEIHVSHEKNLLLSTIHVV